MNEHGMSPFAIELAAKVRGLVAENPGVNQEKIATALGRVQGYVSARMTGKKAWDMDELDVIAELLGMSGPEFLAEVMRRGAWLADSVTILTSEESESRHQSRR